jgi:hypothetical protein
MTLLVVIACVVGAFLCGAVIVTALTLAWMRRGPVLPRGGFVAAAGVAAALLGLAGAFAAVDAKVSDGDRAAASPSQATPATGWALERGDLTSFGPHAELHAGATQDALCLMQFYNKDPTASRSSRWWTSCDFGEQLHTVAEIRERLALPRSWGPRDARVIAHVPAGAEIDYVKGVAAPQCPQPEGRCYSGGGVQYRVLGIDAAWLDVPQCLTTSNETAPLAYAQCRAS